jgi:hypothetical protein
MLTLPVTMVAAVAAFASCFSPRVWRHAQVLLAGALLAPAQRTVAAARPTRRVVRHAAWYRKPSPTFSDVLALVRRELWRHQTFLTSAPANEVAKVPRAIIERLTETLCYVA